MGGMFGGQNYPSPKPAEKAPSITDSVVNQAAEQANRQRLMARGRASTFLVDPQTQTEAEPNQQRYLGGR